MQLYVHFKDESESKTYDLNKHQESPSMKDIVPSPGRQNALASYFQQMSSGENVLLDAKGEAALAYSLREGEERLWYLCLEFAPLTQVFTACIAATLDEKKQVSTKGIRAAASRHLKNNTEKSKASLQRSAQKLSIFMREADPDQEALGKHLAFLKDVLSNKASIPANTCTQEKLATHYKSLKQQQTLALAIRNRFVSSNLGLVVSVARRYQFSGMTLPDLIQEGNLGLLKAVSRFDERRGFRFSTYATWWIRHAVGRSVSDKSRVVRVPVHVSEAHQKIKRVSAELISLLGREPSREEIADALEISVAKLEKTMRSAQSHALSLDAPIGEDGDRARMEVFTLNDGASAFDTLSQAALSNRATKALDSLAPLEIEILHRRFGLAGKTATTLQEIANTVGKSRERIRQIQEKALMKLREHLVAEHAV